MSCRVHTAGARFVALQFDTAAAIDEAFGYDSDEPERQICHLILNDLDNFEAIVIRGTGAQYRDLACRILDLVGESLLQYELDLGI